MDDVLKTPHRMILASAGAGKTYQLTHRYIDLLHQRVLPEQILATTFTRKAAGEIQAKIFDRLAEAVESAEAREQVRQMFDGKPRLSEMDCRAMLVSLARSLHRLSITTIDGFFNRIAQAFRYELDVPLDPQIVDDAHPLAMELRARAIEAMLADEDLPTLIRWLRMLHHDAAGRSVSWTIDRIIAKFYDVYQAAPARDLWDRIRRPAALDADEVWDLIERLAGLGEDDVPKTAKGAPNKTWMKALAADKQQVREQQWDQFIDGGIAGALIDREKKGRYGRVEVPRVWRGIYEPLIEHARAVLLRRLMDRHLAIFDLLDRFAEHYQTLRRDRRMLLFSDLTHKLARQMAVADDATLMDIYFRLDASVGHLLLDEFQDTSLDQWAVLRPIAQEIAAHGQPSLAGGRSFFCVGDTKQAIYGWRGGCTALFDQVPVELHLPASARRSLAKSYRSSQVVLDVVNQVFSDLADNSALADEYATEAAARFEAGFERHVAAGDLPGHVCVESSPMGEAAEASTGGDDDDEPDALVPPTSHERHVAARVKAIHEDAPWASIAVLVATNKMANRMIFQLREIGLAASGEGGGTLADSPAVATVLSALTLADHPSDQAAAFHVLNSPLGELVGIESTQVNHVEKVARRIRQTLLSRGYAQTLADWTASLAGQCERANLERLEQLIELADGFELSSPLRPSQFVRYVEATPVERAEPAPIRVMTVNKAKGLEFHVVVLPQLDHRFMGGSEFLIERQTPTGPIEAVHPAGDSNLRKLSATLSGQYDQQRAEQRYEDLCKLYVAMTRAAYALHVVVKPDDAGASLAKVLRAGLGLPRKDGVGEQVLHQAGDARWYDHPGLGQAGTGPVAPGRPALDKVKLAGAGDAGPRRSWAALSPSAMENQGRVTGRELLNIGSSRARHRGILIHQWFEMIEFLEGPESRPSKAALLAAGRQIFPEHDDEFFEPMARQFLQMLEKAEVAEAFAKDGAVDLWRERAFAVRDGGRLLRGQFDRVTVHEAGKERFARITDFKTDRLPEPGQTAFAAALEAKVTMYQPQLEAYRRALGRILRLKPNQVETRLLFVEVGKLVRV